MFFQKIKAVFEWISARRMKQSRKVLDYPWTTHQSIRVNPPPAESSASRADRAESEHLAAAAVAAQTAASVAPEAAKSVVPQETVAQSAPVAAKRTRAAKVTTTVKKKSALKTTAAAKKSTAKSTAAEDVPKALAIAEEKPGRSVKTTEKSAENPVEKQEGKPQASADSIMDAAAGQTPEVENAQGNSLVTPARRIRRTHPRPPAGTLHWGEDEEKPADLRIASLRGGAKRRVTAASPGADFLAGRSLKELRGLMQERFPEAAALGRAVKFAAWLDAHREGREFLAAKLAGTVRRCGRPPKKTTGAGAKGQK